MHTCENTECHYDYILHYWHFHSNISILLLVFYKEVISPRESSSNRSLIIYNICTRKGKFCVNVSVLFLYFIFMLCWLYQQSSLGFCKQWKILSSLLGRHLRRGLHYGKLLECLPGLARSQAPLSWAVVHTTLKPTLSKQTTILFIRTPSARVFTCTLGAPVSPCNFLCFIVVYLLFIYFFFWPQGCIKAPLKSSAQADNWQSK